MLLSSRVFENPYAASLACLMLTGVLLRLFWFLASPSGRFLSYHLLAVPTALEVTSMSLPKVQTTLDKQAGDTLQTVTCSSAHCVFMQFYDSLKEAAQLAARSTTRHCQSPSLSGDAILPAAAAVKAEPSAAAANTAEPSPPPQMTQPAGFEACAGLPLHPSLASASAADAAVAAAQPSAEQGTSEVAMPVSVEKTDGKQPKAEKAAQLGQAAAATDRQEEPVSLKPACADPGQQTVKDIKAEARRVKAACSERMRAKKLAAKGAKADAAEAASASVDKGQAKKHAEAGKARAQKAKSASVESNEVDAPAARQAEVAEVQKSDSVQVESSQAKQPTAGTAQAETKARESDSAALAKSQDQQPVVGKAKTGTKALKADSVQADKNPARKPTAEDIKADTDAQEPASGQAGKSQAKKPATIEAAKKVEAEKVDPASAKSSQGHQAVAQADKPEASRADACAKRDKLRPASLVSETGLKTSDANAEGNVLSRTAAAAAFTGQQHPAGKANEAALADAVSSTMSYLPLVSVEVNGRSCSVVPGVIHRHSIRIV